MRESSQEVVIMSSQSSKSAAARPKHVKFSRDGTTAKPGEEIRNEAVVLTTLLTATPNLRAKFFANPTRQVGRILPPAKSWDYYRKPGRGMWFRPFNWYAPYRYRNERAELAKGILDEITQRVADQKITASVNTDSVFEEYFAPIVKVSQRSFASVYALSIAAFVVGISLIGIGAYIAISPKSGANSPNSTVVASVFGGSGAISSLGAVFAMARKGIREATLDHARVRVVLTAFATQLGQLRAIIEAPPGRMVGITADQLTIDNAAALNGSIAESMKAALAGIPPTTETADSSGASSAAPKPIGEVKPPGTPTTPE
jgi:hypothetical protein